MWICFLAFKHLKINVNLPSVAPLLIGWTARVKLPLHQGCDHSFVGQLSHHGKLHNLRIHHHRLRSAHFQWDSPSACSAITFALEWGVPRYPCCWEALWLKCSSKWFPCGIFPNMGNMQILLKLQVLLGTGLISGTCVKGVSQRMTIKLM